MNTSVDKTPNKKRKSLGVQNKTPAKAARIDESVKSPKNAKSPKVEIKPVANNITNNATPKNVAQAKSPKKQIKPENKVAKPENGVGQKLNKFKGTKSLEDNIDKKQKKQQKKKEKRKKATNMAKKDFLLAKLNKRVEKEGKEAVIKSLNEKIDSIASRTEVTKQGKRTLRNYKQLLHKLSGVELSTNTPKPANKEAKNKKKNDTAAAIPKEVKPKQGKKNQKVEDKQETAPKKKLNQKAVEKEEDDEEEDSDYDLETSFKDVKNAEFEDDSDEDEDGSDEDEEETDDEDEGESDEDEEVSGEEEGNEKSDIKAQPKKVIENKNAKPQQNNEKSQKKSRYVLFIGNIAYDTTKEELKEHFKRVGVVVDVRIPTDKESNRPRGFAYVELADEAAYQKSLDLNGSQLKNRKIKVEYTQGGNKNSEDKKKEIKSKNFKLHAMRQQGKGSPFKGQRGSPNKGPNRGSPFKGNHKK